MVEGNTSRSVLGHQEDVVQQHGDLRASSSDRPRLPSLSALLEKSPFSPPHRDGDHIHHAPTSYGSSSKYSPQMRASQADQGSAKNRSDTMTSHAAITSLSTSDTHRRDSLPQSLRSGLHNGAFSTFNSPHTDPRRTSAPSDAMPSLPPLGALNDPTSPTTLHDARPVWMTGRKNHQHQFDGSAGAPASAALSNRRRISPISPSQHSAEAPLHESSTSSSSPAHSAQHPHTAFSSATHRRWSNPHSSNEFSPILADLFRQMWGILQTAHRYLESHARESTSSGASRPLPSVREGDLTTLRSCVRHEIDLLHRTDPRLAEYLAQDLGAIDERIHWAEQQLQQQQSQHQEQERQRQQHQQQQQQQQQQKQRAYYPSDEERGYRQQMPSGYGAVPTNSVPDYQSMYPGSAEPANIRYSDMSSTHPIPYAASRGHDARRYSTTSVYGHRHPHPYSHESDPSPSSSPYSAPPYGPNAYQVSASLPKRVRKRRDEAEQQCLSCSASETPEWRKGPTGPRTLCNACGLLFAKQCRKREMMLQAQGKRIKGVRLGGPDRMTHEERENSLLELQLAVQARNNQGSSASGTLHAVGMTAPTSSAPYGSFDGGSDGSGLQRHVSQRGSQERS